MLRNHPLAIIRTLLLLLLLLYLLPPLHHLDMSFDLLGITLRRKATHGVNGLHHVYESVDHALQDDYPSNGMRLILTTDPRS